MHRRAQGTAGVFETGRRPASRSTRKASLVVLLASPVLGLSGPARAQLAFSTIQAGDSQLGGLLPTLPSLTPIPFPLAVYMVEGRNSATGASPCPGSKFDGL